MERRVAWTLLVLLLTVAGCNSSTPPAPTGSAASTDSAATNSPSPDTNAAAQIAHEFLDAVVKGDTSRAGSLLTPLAVERIDASGKPFQLPGLANYTFRVGQVRQPAEDKAFVQCMGTDRSAQGPPVEEEFCWLMTKVGQDWRIAGISYTAGPEKTLMIYSFEDPEKGAIPVQQLMARASGQTAGADAAQSATQPPGQPSVRQPAPVYPPQSVPRTAQEPTSGALYR